VQSALSQRLQALLAATWRQLSGEVSSPALMISNVVAFNLFSCGEVCY
jgi:hypothetical protein